MNKAAINIDCRIWLNRQDQNYLGDRRVKLLEEINATGSITQAARKIDMSYKAAKGAVNGDVIIDIGEGLEIFANITNESIDELQLVPGKDAVAIIKASFVILSPDKNVRISARNRLVGTIVKTIAGAVNSEVKIELADGRIITAVITSESLQEFGFVPGGECCALVKASHVIIAVND